MNKLSLFGSLIACAVCAAAVFSAAPQRSIAVSYADLDLTQKHDRRTLDRRIDHAVARICGLTQMAKSGLELERVNACRQQASANAAKQLAAVISRQPEGLASLNISAQP